MGAHEYLEKYVRSTSEGAIAWERSIFSRTGQWTTMELIDAAVDIAWDAFGAGEALERPALEIDRDGNYFVISMAVIKNGNFLAIAA